MTKKRDPGALAGATGADRKIAQRRPDHLTKPRATKPPIGAATADQSTDRAVRLDDLGDAARGASGAPRAGDPGSEPPIGDGARAGRMLGVPDIEPWPEPVDGAALL